ncbi:MAG: flagellar hook-associated protein FlgK [Calditrichia bacterium]
MSGILGSLEIARKALWASRLGLDVTSQNIANVNTPGYSRQRVDLTPSNPVNLGFGPLGTGVLVKRISRARVDLIDRNLRDAYTRQGYGQAQETVLMQLDSVYNEPSENGLAYQITDFFNEWSNLASNPEDSSARQILMQKSVKLAATFRDTTNKLHTMRKSIESQVSGEVRDLNQILKDLASVNGKIVNAEIGGTSANDLRDMRDKLVDELAKFGKVTFSEDSRGSSNINLEGVTVVTGTDYQEFTYAVENNDLGVKELHLKLKSTGEIFNSTTGKLGSYVYQFNELIPEQLDNLDQIASSLITEVNKIHSKSYGLPQGSPPTASTGFDFFTGGDAASIRINKNVEEDLNKIAISVSGEPGDAEGALAISNLSNKKMFGNRTQTINEFYQTMISKLGNQIDDAQSIIAQQDLVVGQLESQKDSISGVNLDEEMINLTKFQRSFEAASKVIKTVDEMMQTILTLK